MLTGGIQLVFKLNYILNMSSMNQLVRGKNDICWRFTLTFS